MNHLTRLPNQRISGVVVRDDEHHARFFDRLHKVFGLGEIECQRFVADDVEAAFDGRFGNLIMCVVRCGNGDKIDAIVTGVGTGGTITGVGRFIKFKNPAFKCIAVEPADSSVISGGQPGRHEIQGIGAGFIPKNLDTSLVDEVITITNDEAFGWARRLSIEEGILGGISSGANVCAAFKVAARPEFEGKTICTIIPSFGERYIQTKLFDPYRYEGSDEI